MAHKVALVTDSTCDIPDDLIQRYGIYVQPLYVIWGHEALRDRVEMQPEEFYARLKTDSHFPTTAQATPGEFLATYQAAKVNGAEEIVVVTVSSAMSGTIESARQAAEMIDIPVHLVDAKGPTMTVGWQVLAAARAREAGGTAADMVAAAERARRSMVQVVCMDTLEYVYKGGRIGNATHFIGTLLNIKPIVYINHESGLVEPLDRARGHKKAIETFYQGFFSRLNTAAKTVRIAVLHGAVLAEAEALAERIWQEFSPAELLINITGPVLGVHTGPGALALCGYSED